MARFLRFSTRKSGNKGSEMKKMYLFHLAFLVLGLSWCLQGSSLFGAVVHPATLAEIQKSQELAEQEANRLRAEFLSLQPNVKRPLGELSEQDLFYILSNGSPDREKAIVHEYLQHHHYDLVLHTALSIYRNLPNSSDLQELIQEGQMGLRRAMDSFDREKGVLFQTYAFSHIRGSILDFMRLNDKAPRLTRARQKAISIIRAELLQEFEREPNTEEIRQKLKEKILRNEDFIPANSRAEFLIKSYKTRKGHAPSAEMLQMMVESEVKKIISDGLSVPEWTSLDAEFYENSGRDSSRPQSLHEDLVDESATKPAEEVALREAWDRLLRPFNLRERLILRLYYQEGMTFKEIGGVIGISESRVSQMLALVLQRLKAMATSDIRTQQALKAFAEISGLSQLIKGCQSSTNLSKD